MHYLFLVGSIIANILSVKSSRKFCFVLFCFVDYSFSNVFDSTFNHYSGNQIQEIAVIGERCSGTNFARELIGKNFPNCDIVTNTKDEGRNKYAHKHFFPWINLTNYKIKLKLENADCSFLNNSNKCLFIFIVRNVYDWLRSFYLTPYHVSPNLLNQGFLHFISTEWKVEDRPLTSVDQWNPYEQRPFSNVIELRKYKIMNYLSIGNYVDNFLIVRYEDLVENRENFISYVSEKYNIKIGEMNVGEIYHKKKYFDFQEIELEFINNHVDWNIEKLLGY
jgi:hypothetical protein